MNPPVSTKSLLKIGFHRFGGLKLVRLYNRGRARILAFHRFPADQTFFQRQCAYLRQNYTPVSLGEITDRLRSGRPVSRNAIALTVDDGYLDFYRHAYPILKRYGISAAVFLMTDFVGGQNWPWWDRVEYSFTHTALQTVSFALDGDEALASYELTTSTERESACFETVERLKRVPNKARLAFLARLPDVFKVDLPTHAPAAFEALSWDQVREMSGNGIEFGAHTKSHPILSVVESEAELREEICGSKRRIADELGREPEHFCYPNGRNQDIGAAARRIVEEARFKGAVTTEPGLIDSVSDPFMLRRIVLEPDLPELYFRQRLAGLRA